MALSAFDDKTKPPVPEELAARLGGAAVLWDELRRRAGAGSLVGEWGFTAKSTGWGLRLKQGRRVILYMTPCEGYFLASFALGEKAVQAARASDLSASVLAVLDGARKYAEGRGVRLEVRSAEDLRNVLRLAEIKLAS